MKIGIPRGLFYYYYGDLWISFFDKLGIDYVISPETNHEIMMLGNKFSTDEMCLSLKTYIGHVAYLSKVCDCILVPRIDDFGMFDQTCTNFLACYDIINNLFDNNILDYNICYTHNEDEENAFLRLGKFFGKSSSEIRNAYFYSVCMYNKSFKRKIGLNYNRLNSDGKKILLVSHSYNMYDSLIGKPIVDCLKSMGCVVIYSDLFDKKECLKKSSSLSKGLFWKYSKEIIGSIELCKDRVDGIIFLSTFPCGLDSLVNEVVMRKLNKRCLNIVVDGSDAFAGIQTRLESFIDILV